MTIDDEINDLKQSIADQLRINEAEFIKMNTAIRGRVAIQSQIGQLEATIARLEEKEALNDAKLTDTLEKLSSTKNNQRTRMRLGEQMRRQLDASHSITQEMERTRQLLEDRNAHLSNVDELMGGIATRQALGQGNETALNSSLAELEKERVKQLRDAHEEALAIDRKRTLDAKTHAKRLNDAHEDALKADEKRTKDITGAWKSLRNELGKVVLALSQMVQSGIEFGRTVGTSRTGGVGLDFENRLSSVFQLAAPDVFATRQQMQQAQQGLITTMGGVREGFQLSADGTRAFVQQLNKGFGTEFEMTSGALRALITTGMSTRAEFDRFRKSTGLANLSSQTFERIVSKNSLSFMVLGNSFAKTAIEAERLGINLSAASSAQEAMVSNLDGVIDTVQQLNQMGANVDLGTLISLADNPDQSLILKYLQNALTPDLFRSVSTRVLVKGLGLPLEDLMKKQGSIQEQASKGVEKALTEQDQSVSMLTKAATSMQLQFNATTTAFGTLIGATIGVITSFVALTKTSGALSVLNVRRGLGGAGATAAMQGPKMAGAAGAARIGGGMVAGAAGGLTIGTIAATLGTLAAVVGGGYLAYKAYQHYNPPDTADDMVSGGYGKRTIVTPKGSIALNNSDTVVAGTDLGGGNDSSALVKKIEDLISKLNDATTVIEIGGQRQRVPRLSLVGVNSRYDVE